MEVRQVYCAERAQAIGRLTEEWGAPMLVHGEVYAFEDCEIWMAGEMAGLAAVSGRDRPVAELVAINAFVPWRGIGTALLTTIAARLWPEFETLRLTTTNDNVDALRFYQRRGFRLTALRAGAVDHARLAKPSIPTIGEHGIPLRDEIDLLLELGVE
jgi:GNAT superfamily N-acetyltransferase